VHLKKAKEVVEPVQLAISVCQTLSKTKHASLLILFILFLDPLPLTYTPSPLSEAGISKDYCATNSGSPEVELRFCPWRTLGYSLCPYCVYMHRGARPKVSLR